MLGRVVLVLCSLTGTALACPSRASPPSEDALGVAVAIALGGCVAIAFLWARANGARRSFSSGRRQDVLELEVFRRIAHVQRIRTAWLLLFGLPAMLGVMTCYMDPTAAFVVFPLIAVAASIGVARLCRLDRLATLSRNDSIRVVSDGYFLFAARGKDLLGWVAAPPSAVARASGLPVAKLRV